MIRSSLRLPSQPNKSNELEQRHPGRLHSVDSVLVARPRDAQISRSKVGQFVH
jgi:hypothetical protein